MHVLSEHNGTKTELYRTNAKSRGLVPAHFALIIIIVVHVIKHQSVINAEKTHTHIQCKYMQKAGEPENDAGFLKVIIIAAVQLNYNYSYPSKPRVVVTVFRLH